MKKRKRLFLLGGLSIILPVILFLLGQVGVREVQGKLPAGGTPVTSDIMTDTTWTLSGSPYFFSQSINVAPSATLTIEPGVTVLGEGEATYLYVLGHIAAVGTVSQPITFTTIIMPPFVFSWGGLTVMGSGDLAYVNLEWGNYLGAFDLSPTGLSIRDSRIAYSYLDALAIGVDVFHLVDIQDVTIDGNNDRIVLAPVVGGNNLGGSASLKQYDGLEGYILGFGSLTIPEDITLTVESGVSIGARGPLIVEGHLEALGTPDLPVVFRARSDASTPPHIYIRQGTARFENSRFNSWEYALKFANQEPDWALGTRVWLSDSLIRQSDLEAILIPPSALHALQMDNVIFEDNFSDVVYVPLEGGQQLSDGIYLSSQPGLDGYQVGDVADVQNLVIPAGINLIVGAGSNLLFGEQVGLQVEGHLQTNGTSLAPVNFTSMYTTWQGISLEGGNAFISHANIQQTSEHGFRVIDGNLSVYCSQIHSNQGGGVFIDSSGIPNVTITNSDIMSNGNGLNNANPTLVSAENNWWGDSTGPGGDGPGGGDTVFGNVSYTPWLTEPACAFTTYLLNLPIIMGE